MWRGGLPASATLGTSPIARASRTGGGRLGDSALSCSRPPQHRSVTFRIKRSCRQARLALLAATAVEVGWKRNLRLGALGASRAFVMRGDTGCASHM